MNGLPKGEHKINQKMHNKFFKYNQLKSYQYSTVIIGDENELNIYVYKWFIALVAVPMLIYGSFVMGFIPAFKELRDVWVNPVWRCDLPQIPDGLLKLENALPPQSK
ncbi:hypothetical protein [Xenorhabdus budapestensis]|uniref:Uncharacterized protein n=1 Tax=Xenorhabdus budapestensis TaxID=290110 RepID=A0A2D0IJG6_XENBU|nr:hypothetical protein [Xenorhabdus budapestensis]PHM21899.1 hypothetical protein Xbud_03853 [Xenorhabdus budapestensis]